MAEAEPPAKPKRAAGPKRRATPKRPARAKQAPAEPEAPLEPIDLDAPPAGLPVLEFPRSEELAGVEEKAAQRRRRLRVEAYGAGLLVVIGMIGTILFGLPQLLLLSLLAVGGLVAWEMLVVNLQ